MVFGILDYIIMRLHLNKVEENKIKITERTVIKVKKKKELISKTINYGCMCTFSTSINV